MQQVWKIGFAFSSFMLFLGGRSPVCAAPDTEKAMTVNLADYGWQPLPPRSQREWQGTKSQLLAIDQHGRALIRYTIRETVELTRCEQPALSFRIVRIGPDGKTDLSLALPTNNGFSAGVYVDAADHLLARANGTLQILSGDDQTPPEQRTWSPLAECTMNCDIEQSASRRTLIVRNVVEADHFTYTVLVFTATEGRANVLKDGLLWRKNYR
jgi:hypothetical protein